jgi:hypothetical protein
VTLEEAKEHADAGEYSKAWPAVAGVLNETPDDPRALNIACFMLEKQGNAGIAYQVAKRLTEMHPGVAIAWVNLGKCCDTLWRMEEAEAAYRRALNHVKAGDTQTKVTVLCNLSALFLQQGKFRDARKYAEQALKLEPTHLKSRHNLGLCLMAAGEWKEGWQQYEASVGSPQRIAWNYTGEPTWKGEPGKTVVVFGEQGIGDEICAASMFKDAIAVSKKVIIDCDKRLEKLFRRSFPAAKVYGTRNEKVLGWDDEDQEVDASIAAMQLGALFRPRRESFPVRPYLSADFDQTLMWRALWRSKGKPAVGIAWTGGIKETGQNMRSISVDMLKPLLGMDATFVSLQYKDASTEIKGSPLLQYDAVLQKDYDTTASLVASLDAVVSVPTSVAHLAGALGVPTVAMKASASCWKYEAGLPFHPCHLIENEGWESTIFKAADKLHSILHV